jgi:hypothetical protein
MSISSPNAIRPGYLPRHNSYTAENPFTYPVAIRVGRDPLNP